MFIGETVEDSRGIQSELLNGREGEARETDRSKIGKDRW